jgi:hypothetical protein
VRVDDPPVDCDGRVRRRRFAQLAQQVIGEHRPQEGYIDQCASELLGHERHLDTRGAVGT